jgi:RNA polymerase sigma-70 factor (family 1)
MNSTRQKSEPELIRELKQGSMRAFDAIYSLYFKRLYAYCLQFTKSREDAEEIVQVVMLRLWNIKETIRQEKTLRSLLFIMSKHYLINAYHNNINSPVFEDYVNYKNELSVNGSIQEHLDYEDFLSRVKQALKQLPQSQQTVIELSRLKDMSINEIAEQLSLSEQTVKNRLSLGMKTLRSLLGITDFVLLFYVKYTVLRFFLS